MTQTSSHAEREVERARADLSQTLDALKDRLSLDRVFEDVRSQFLGSTSGEFTSNLTRQLKENPMPAMLIGVGALMLMMSERNRAKSRAVRVYPETGTTTGYGESAGEFAQHTAAQVGEFAQQTAQQVGEGLRSTAQSMYGAGEEAAHMARSAAAGAGESMRSMAGGVGDTMRHAGDSAAAMMHQARGAAQSAGESAGQMGQRTMQSVNAMIDQQPLMVGAIGMALGALVGAMLPITRTENEYLGETRDQMREAIAEQSGQLYERGKVTATEAYRAAAEEARAQGLVPEGTGGKTLAEKAEEVLARAGEAAREATQREMGAAEKALGGEQGARAQPEPEPGPGQTAGRQPQEGIRPGPPIIPDRPASGPPVRKS